MLYLPANLTFWQVSNFAAVSFIYALHSRGEILYRVHYRNAYNNEDTAKQSILIETVWMTKSAERIEEWMKFQPDCTQLNITLAWDLITSIMHAPFQACKQRCCKGSINWPLRCILHAQNNVVKKNLHCAWKVRRKVYKLHVFLDASFVIFKSQWHDGKIK